MDPVQTLARIEALISVYSAVELVRTATYFRKPEPSTGVSVLATIPFAALFIGGNSTYVYGIFKRVTSGTAGLGQVATVAVLQVASHLLWAWACRTVAKGQFTVALSKDKPKELVTTGPYAYVRNPFYTAYLLTYAATALLSGRPVDFALWVCFYVCYYLVTIGEQRKFEKSELAEAYARFKATRARFFYGDF